MTCQTLFFYGSLRDAALLQAVTGRAGADLRPVPARLADHEARVILGESFPGVVAAPGATLDGVVLEDLCEAEFARVAFFEDDAEFDLRDVQVRVAGRAAALDAKCFFPKPPHRLGAVWDFDAWRRDEQPFALECAREIMAHHAAGGDWSDLSLWPGIKARARARVQAAAEPPRKGVSGFGRDDVRVVGVARPYASFFAVEELTLRHRRFGGGWSPEIRRAVWVSGDAVTVLPYDPRRDEVLLITQWRAGPQARGDSDPWPLEVIAGRLDMDATTADTARREALEEAGLTLGRMEKAAGFYASPGTVAEFITAYVAEADLSGAGGVHGLEQESEDIRSLAMTFDAAMETVENHEANTSPTLISLLWLARHRDRLRASWGG